MKETLTQVALLFGVVAVATAAASLGGGVDLGTALGFGQVAFVLALVYVLLRR